MYLHNTLYFDFLISCKISCKKLYSPVLLPEKSLFFCKDVAKINKYFKRTKNAKNNLTVC